MPDEEVGSSESKHNLLRHNREGGREGEQAEKNTQETEDVLLLFVE